MNFNKTTSYSLHVLSYMAKHESDKMSASYLNDQLEIPYSYLRRILNNLSKNGFIHSKKGRNGGFGISKDINTIYLADIIEATEGLESYDRCIMGFSKCPFNNECPMHQLWDTMRTNILNTLKKTSLNDLLKKQNNKKQSIEI